MLTTTIIDDQHIKENLDAVRELARRAHSALPVHQMYLPEIWHRHFHSDSGLDFNRKRGKGLFGAMTGVSHRLLILVREEEELLGAAYLVEMRSKLAGESEERIILTFPGDSALLPYQDFITVEQNRAAILQRLLDASLHYADSLGAVLFLGYIPDSSPHLSLMQQQASPLQHQDRRCLSMPNRRRGGIYPWSIDAIIGLVQDMQNIAAESGNDFSLTPVLEKLQQTSPMLLHFPRTRLALEQQLDHALAAVAGMPEVARQLASLHTVLQPAEIAYPFIQLPDSEEAYLAQLSKGTRRYFRRYKKQFLQQGGEFVKIEADAVTPQDIDDYLALHHKRWGKESAAVNDQTVAFHKEVCAAYAEQGMMSLFFAQFEGQRIAAHSCFDIGDRREGYFTGRNPDFDHLRAGRLLYMETILDAVRRGYKIYDLGYGDDAYKFSLTKTAARTHHFIFASPNNMPDLDKLFPHYECLLPEEPSGIHNDEAA